MEWNFRFSCSKMSKSPGYQPLGQTIDRCMILNNNFKNLRNKLKDTISYRVEKIPQLPAKILYELANKRRNRDGNCHELR